MTTPYRHRASPMSLDTRPPYPHGLCYVLKLHCDSSPGQGHLFGVLEHVGSGAVMAFHSLRALQTALLEHAAAVHAQTPGHAPHQPEHHDE